MKTIKTQWNLNDEAESPVIVSHYGSYEKYEEDTNSGGQVLIEDIKVFPLDDRGRPLPGVNVNTGDGDIYFLLGDEGDEGDEYIENACRENFTERSGPANKEDVPYGDDRDLRM